MSELCVGFNFMVFCLILIYNRISIILYKYTFTDDSKGKADINCTFNNYNIIYK